MNDHADHIALLNRRIETARAEAEQLRETIASKDRLLPSLLAEGKALEQARAEKAETALAAARQECEVLRGALSNPLLRTYVPQDVAAECLQMLAPLDAVGEPNTLWALVHKAMSTIETLKKRVHELTHCRDCDRVLTRNLGPICSDCANAP